MLYILLGRLLSLFVYYLLFNLFDNFYIIEKLFCWFLLEHVFESYSQTTGKLFLVNKDFRELVLNTLISFRNIITLSYFYTLVEFLILGFLTGIFIYILFYLIKNKNTRTYYLNSLFLLVWCISMVSVLMSKIYYTFTWFDLAFIFQPILLGFSFSLVFYSFYLVTYIFGIIIKERYSNFNLKKFSDYNLITNEIVSIKLRLYCYIFVSLLVRSIKNSLFLNDFSIKEFLICLNIILGIYMFYYYFIKEILIVFVKLIIFYDYRLIVMRFKFYCLIFSIMFFSLFYLTFENAILLDNNFFQELLIKILYIYTLLYYY